MRRSTRLLAVVPVVALVASATPATAGAASTVRPAAGPARSALIRALVRQDGSSAGVTGVYISRTHPRLGVVCQRTPDSGKVSYLFKRNGHRWSYLTNDRSGTPRSKLERTLEGVC